MMAVRRVVGHAPHVTMTFPSSPLALAAQDISSIALTGVARQALSDLIFVGIEGLSFAPLIGSSTVFAFETKLWIIRPAFLSLMRPLNALLLLAIQKQYAREGSQSFDAVFAAVEKHGREAAERAEAAEFPSSVVDSLRYATFTTTRWTRALIDIVIQRPSSLRAALGDIPRIALASNEFELLAGTLHYASAHPRRVNSLRVLECLADRSVEATDAYVRRLATLGIEP